VTTRAVRSMRDRWTTTMSRATFEARRGHGFEREWRARAPPETTQGLSYRAL